MLIRKKGRILFRLFEPSPTAKKPGEGSRYDNGGSYRMTFGSPKYFGEQAFNDVYCKLVEKARNKQNPIDYEEVAVIMGKNPKEKMGHYWENETGHMLREICEYEHKHNRPMLSAIVVLKGDGIPGKGFFELARGLGKLISMSKPDEISFWKQELIEVYKTWG